MNKKKPSELIRDEKRFPKFLNALAQASSLLPHEVGLQILQARIRGCSREFIAECLELKGM